MLEFDIVKKANNKSTNNEAFSFEIVKASTARQKRQQSDIQKQDLLSAAYVDNGKLRIDKNKIAQSKGFSSNAELEAFKANKPELYEAMGGVNYFPQSAPVTDTNKINLSNEAVNKIVNRFSNTDTNEIDGIIKTLGSGEWQDADTMKKYADTVNTYANDYIALNELGYFNHLPESERKSNVESLKSLKEVVNSSKDVFTGYKDEESYKAAIQNLSAYDEVKNADPQAVRAEIDKWQKELDVLENGKEWLHGDWRRNSDGNHTIPYSATSIPDFVGKTISEIRSMISQKREFLRLAENEAQITDLTNIAQSAVNFKANSKFEPQLKYNKSGLNVGGVKDLILEYIHGNKELQGQITLARRGVLALEYGDGVQLTKDMYDWSEFGYDQLNKEEKKIATYYYKTNIDAFWQYMDANKSIWKNRGAIELADKMSNIFGGKTFTAVAGSVDRIGQSIQGGINYVFGNETYVEPTKTQLTSQYVRQNLEGFGAFMYDAVDTFTYMTPSILVNAVLPGSGFVVTGITAAGSAYNDGINMGMTASQARTYGTLIGVAEAGLESLFSGVAGLTGKITGKSIEKVVAGINSGIIKFVATVGVNAASEGFEEFAQEVLEPLFENIALGYDKNSWDDVDWDAAVYSGLLGMFMGSVSNIAPTAVNIASDSVNSKLKYGLSQESLYALVNNGLAMPEGSAAYSQALKADARLKSGKSMSGTTLYNLATAIESEIEAKSTARLNSFGVDKKMAKELSPVVAKAVFGKKLTSEENDVLNGSKYGRQIIKELSSDRVNTIWKNAIEQSAKKDADILSAYKRPEAVKALTNEGFETPVESRAYTLAHEFKEKLNNGNEISAVELNQLIEDNKQAFRTEDKSKITYAVVARLGALGETGDIYKLASIIVKRALGKNLTMYENNIFKNSKNCQRVLNELNINNVVSGKYSSEWAKNIDVNRIGNNIYNSHLQENTNDGIIDENEVEKNYTDKEYKAAILRYQSGEAYKINAKLGENETLDESEQYFVSVLNEALQQLPSYEGTVYRNVVFDDFGGVDAYNEFLEKHIPGQIIFYEQFLSCSKEQDGYPVEGNLQVHFVIESKNARDVDGYGNNMENEVIYPSNSVFVVKKKFLKNNIPTIYLQEAITNVGYNTDESTGSTVQYMQTQYTGNTNLQGLPQWDSTRDNFWRIGSQSATSVRQRDTVRTRGRQDTVLPATREEQKVVNKQEKQIDADKFIKGLSGEDSKSAAEQGEGSQSRADGVVDSDKDFNYNDNSIKEGEMYAEDYQGTMGAFGRENREDDAGGTSENAEITREDKISFERRIKRTYKNSGRLFIHLNVTIACKEPKIINNNLPAGVAYNILKSKGYNVVYCDGPILINNNKYTVERTQAVTIFDGTIYISSDSTLNGEGIALHEVVHVWQYANLEKYLNYKDVLCEELILASEKYKEIAKGINDNHYNGRYDIEDINSFEYIMRELTAYISQYVCANPKFAREKFGGMFGNWDNVVQAVYDLNNNLGFGDIIKEATSEEVAFSMPIGKQENANKQITSIDNFEYKQYNNSDTYFGENLYDTPQNLKPSTEQEWHVFCKSFANKTTNIRQGDFKIITIFTADNYYIINADGYMSGTVLFKNNIDEYNEKEQIFDDDTSTNIFAAYDEGTWNRERNRDYDCDTFAGGIPDTFDVELDEFIAKHPEWFANRRESYADYKRRLEATSSDEVAFLNSKEKQTNGIDTDEFIRGLRGEDSDSAAEQGEGLQSTVGSVVDSENDLNYNESGIKEGESYGKEQLRNGGTGGQLAGTNTQSGVGSVQETSGGIYRNNRESGTEPNTIYNKGNNRGIEVSYQQVEGLKSTAIKNEDGTPKRVYHFTNNMVFEVFAKGDIGFHFGNESQARQRGENLKQQGRIITAFLDIKNPIYINTDLMSWRPAHVAVKLYANGIITYNQYKNILGLHIESGYEYDSPAAVNSRKILADLGYDGIIYENHYEGDGQSYIAFYPEQVIIIDDGKTHTNKAISENEVAFLNSKEKQTNGIDTDEFIRGLRGEDSDSAAEQGEGLQSTVGSVVDSENDLNYNESGIKEGESYGKEQLRNGGTGGQLAGTNTQSGVGSVQETGGGIYYDSQKSWWASRTVRDQGNNRGIELSQEQVEGLKSTAIKNEDGTPKRVYHFTNNMVFEVFAKGDIGFHFGNESQARQRGENLKQQGRIITAFLDIKNPIYINTDLMSWRPAHVAVKLYANGIITYEQYFYIEKTQVQSGYEYNSPAAVNLRKILADLGYDGIIYENHYEGDGQSYIAFYPEQIIIIDDGKTHTNQAISENEVAFLNLKEKQADGVVDSVKDLNYNDNSIKEGEMYAEDYQRTMGSFGREIREDDTRARSGKTKENAKITREVGVAFQRRTKETYGDARRLVFHLNTTIAYKVADDIDINLPAGTAYNILKSKGYNVVYCDGAFEVNNGIITIEVSEAIALSDGTIYISSEADLNGKGIALHEVVHVWQYSDEKEYVEYEDILSEEIDRTSKWYEKLAEEINFNHYGGKYDIEDISSFKYIIKELAAYINQYVNTDIDYARNRFGGAFRNFENVVRAVYNMNDKLGFGDIIREATSQTQVTSFNLEEKQIDADKFIQGMRGEDGNSAIEQGEVLQSSAEGVVDSDKDFNYNDNSIKEGEYSGIYQGQGLGSSDEETSGAVDSGKEAGVGGIYGETTFAFRRRTKETYGKNGRTVSHLNIIVAYKEANVINKNLPAGVAYNILKSKGYNVVYGDGPILINNNKYTVERTEAVTIFDGTIYISSDSTLNGEDIALHEVVHVWQYGNNAEYSNYESIVFREIDPTCEVYKKVASQINDNHYNGRYDIEDLNSFEYIMRELTAYISQYVCTNPKFAREKFGGMFGSWENVVQAVYVLNNNLGFGDIIKEATSQTQVASFNLGEKQTNEIYVDEFIKGLRGEDSNSAAEQGEELHSTAGDEVVGGSVAEVGDDDGDGLPHDNIARKDGEMLGAVPGVVEGADGKQYFDDGSGDEYFGDTPGNEVAHGGDTSAVGEAVDSENSSDLQLSEPALQDIARAPTAEESIAAAISNDQLDTKQRRILDFVKKHFPEITLKFNGNMTKNGLWDSDSKTLLLNTNQMVTGMYIEVLKHEFMHRLESKRLYQEFKQFLFNKDVTFGVWAKVQCKVHGIELTQNATAIEAISKLTEYYYDSVKNDMAIAKKYREAFTIDGAQREMVADFFGEVMFNGKKYRTQTAQALADETFITLFDENERAKFQASSMAALAEIAEYKPNIFQQIVDWVKRIILKLRGTRIKADAILADELERNIKMLEDYVKQVYNSRDTKKAAENSGGVSAKYSLAANAKSELHKALYDKNYRNEVLLRDETPKIMLSQKGVINRQMVMNASHIRENVFTEDEARNLGLKVDEHTHYHGIGENYFLKIIDSLDNVKEAYRGTKNASDSSRRENYFLLVTEFKDESGNIINVPVFIDELAQCNRVFIQTNKIATVFGREDFRNYINRQVSERNLVRIKNKSKTTSEGDALVAPAYESFALNDSISNPNENVKQKQLDIINETNPMWDDYHTGIRTTDDIRTWAEVLKLNDESEGQFVWGDFSRADAEQALKDGTITVYSSYPINNGTFVSTSYIQAQEYAGGKNGKVYSKTIPLTDIAWINGDEGQYAKIEKSNDNNNDNGSQNPSFAVTSQMQQLRYNPEAYAKHLNRKYQSKADSDVVVLSMQQDNEYDVSLCFVRCDDEKIISKADELEREGKSRVYIKNELGVVRDVFGEWKKYLDINKCKLFANATAKTEGHTRKPGFSLDGYSWEGVLSDFVIWDEFFELFPKYKNLRVVIRSMPSDYDKVRFNPKAKTVYIDKELCREYTNGESKILKSYIMRELQRIIQYEEGRYIGYSIEHWQELEREGKLPFSEKFNRYLTAEDMMKYFEDNYETELMFKKQEFKHYVSQNRKYKSINDMMMYYPVADSEEMIVYDDNGRLVTLKEKHNPKEKRRFSADKESQVKLTTEVSRAEQSNSHIVRGNLNEITEKGDNTLKLRSFVASKQKSFVKEQKVRGDYRIKGGNSGFVEKSGNDGEILDEDYGFMLRSVFAGIPIADHDTVGRYIGINNQEMLEDSVCKNEKGEPISLYFMDLYGDDLSEQIRRGLALGTVDMAVAQYNEHRANHKRIKSAVCTEVYAGIKRPVCLPFDPHDISYDEICDWLVNQDKITPAQHNRVVTMKSALKPYGYSNYATQALLDILREQGYDGIIYKNHRFAEGSKTVVPFYEHQLIPVAYDGILVQDDIIYDDAQDETENLSTVDAAKNTENMKRYVIEPKYQNAKKRKPADERIKIGDAGCFENVETIDAQIAYEKINRELKINSTRELSGYDTAGHRFSNMAIKNFDGDVFKDADGNILLFSMWNMNPLDIGKAADTGQEFVGFETALEEFFEHKISTKNSYHGVIEQFALNCVKPLVVKQNRWNTVKMAAELLEDGIIPQQFYDNIMSLHSTGNGDYMSLASTKLINEIIRKGCDCIVFVKDNGRHSVVPFFAESIIPISQNGILNQNNDIVLLSEADRDANEKANGVVLDPKDRKERDFEELRHKILSIKDKTEKMKRLTESLKYNNAPVWDETQDVNVGYSGAFERGTVNIWNAKSRFERLIASQADIPISDVDTANRTLSRDIQSELANSKLRDKNGRPLSFFIYAKQTQSGFERDTRGYRVSTLAAAHDEYLEISEAQPHRRKQIYNEYFVRAETPYFMIGVPKDFTAREIADSLYAGGVLNQYEYNSILTKSGIDERGYKGIAAKHINLALKNRGIDSIVYMNGTYDRGSMGVMVFDKGQLIPISQNGVPDENFVENAGENEFDSLENNGYNENADEGLTKLEKEEIKEKTGWSDAIVDYIRSIEEAQIYIDADLKEAEINGRKCLIRSDIDMEQVDKKGVTNWERIKQGMAPYAKSVDKIELHHIGQKNNSPLAELSIREHRGKGNDTILHNKKKTSAIERNMFNRERIRYWKIR